MIYSNKIQEHIDLDGTDTEITQVDIFPTILNLVGLNAYPWHGFGNNLLDPDQRNRKYNIWDDYRISEYMIKNNYFKDKKELVN